MSAVHYLKTDPSYLELIWRNEKTAELRRNDRGFKVGDHLVLREFATSSGFGPHCVLVQVTHLLADYPGLEKGFVMVSFVIREKSMGLPRTIPGWPGSVLNDDEGPRQDPETPLPPPPSVSPQASDS